MPRNPNPKTVKKNAKTKTGAKQTRAKARGKELSCYQRFLKSWTRAREGYDYGIIRRCKGEERKELIRELLTNVDGVKAHLLAMLEVGEAVPALCKNLSAKNTDTRIRSARALYDLEGGAEPLRVIAEVLVDRRDKGKAVNTRHTAVFLLRNVRHPVAHAALEITLFDPDSSVRYSAAEAWSTSSTQKTASSTIRSNLADRDEEKIIKLAARMRAKV